MCGAQSRRRLGAKPSLSTLWPPAHDDFAQLQQCGLSGARWQSQQMQIGNIKALFSAIRIFNYSILQKIDKQLS